MTNGQKGGNVSDPGLRPRAAILSEPAMAITVVAVSRLDPLPSPIQPSQRLGMLVSLSTMLSL